MYAVCIFIKSKLHDQEQFSNDLYSFQSQISQNNNISNILTDSKFTFVYGIFIIIFLLYVILCMFTWFMVQQK